MTNLFQNTSKVTIDDKEYTLRLSLGALAQIEDDLNLDSIDELSAVFAKGVKVGSLLKIVSALLTGGGNPLTPAELGASNLDVATLAEAISSCLNGSEKK